MTQMKEKAFQMLQALPDEKVFYVIKIMEGLEGLGKDSKDEKQNALDKMREFRGRLPEDFDYKTELAESRRERYEDDYIVTRNIKDFEKSKVKCIEPEAFIEIMRSISNN